MDLHRHVNQEIGRIIEQVRSEQSQDGAWRYCFEGPLMSDAYMIILLRSLAIHDERLIKQLVYRLITKQEKNGAWKIYADEKEGNLSATIEAYYALLFSHMLDKSDQRLQAAKHFILVEGGLGEADLMTKVMLACTGNYPWPKHLPIPIEMILLPLSSPIDFYDFSGYARAHIAPILITANERFSLKTECTPDLTELMPSRNDSFYDLERSLSTTFEQIKQWVKQFPYSPQRVRESALGRAEQFILERVEPNGTLYSYASATFLMIFALLARGYNKNHPAISYAVSGLKSFVCGTNEGTHIQNSPATVWNTALLSDALQNAGVPSFDPMIQNAGRYLLSRQHVKYGDWTLNNPNGKPGGWGFSDVNTRMSDIDDTTAALRAIRRLAIQDEQYRHAWERGLQWLLSMQNNDGGWPAFEKNNHKKLLTWLPFEGADAVSVDPSSSDLTGRTLAFLGDGANLNPIHRNIKRAIQWLRKNQEKDGSWFGRWGVTYIYGTWAALTGLTAVGVDKSDPMIKKAKHWLINIQNADGGWGESCRSDTTKKYVPLKNSTPSQTAWAIDALIATSAKKTDVIHSGMRRLIEFKGANDWTVTYPTGAGLPGSFYIHYHSYRYIWPLLALGNYKKKFLQ